MPETDASRFTELRLDGAVATVTWSRPERRNAIGVEVCADLIRVLGTLVPRRDVEVVVLRSAAPPFCAGWDVTDFRELAGAAPDAIAAFFRHGRRLLGAVGALPQVTLAAPAGAALGFGCALLARCDLVVAADDCRFGLPEVALGMPPATVLPELLPAMSRRTALRWAVTGERYDAHRAMADGLVTSAVPAARHDEEAYGLAMSLAGHPGNAARATKELMKRLAAAAESERVSIGVDAAIARFAGHAPAGATPEKGRG